MSKTETIVVFHAHPDDEAIFTGATIRLLADTGVRVVLVTATTGGAGEPQFPLLPGETLQQRRVGELERSCELLGVARLVVLGLEDSGAHGGPYTPGTLGAAPIREVAASVASVVREEGASALVHYDPSGIYGHIDHVRVHQVGAQVVRSLGIIGYEATVDSEQLRHGPRHVLHGAASSDGPMGVAPEEVSLAVEATSAALLAKMAAMAAHASQISADWLAPAFFETAYGREWFIRRGTTGVLDRLPTAPRRRAVVGAGVYAADVRPALRRVMGRGSSNNGPYGR